MYKQFVYLSKLYPGDSRIVMNKVRNKYYELEHCTDKQQINKAFAFGLWNIKELQATRSISKYRYLKNNYEFNNNYPSK